MGIFDNVKAFVHSITTDDHYASYDSPYRDSVINNNSNLVGGNNLNSSQTRLNELNNGSSASLVPGAEGGSEAGKQAPFVTYRPGLRSSNTNLNGSDLQLQSLNRNGQPPLPSIDSLWERLAKWLDEEYPELYDSLNDGVTTADLNEFEKDLGCGALPVELRQLYKKCDGQFSGGKPTGLFMGLVFLDLESIIEEHTIWTKVAEKLERQQYYIQKQQKQQLKVDDSPLMADSTDVGSSVEGIKAKLVGLDINNNFIANQRSIPPNSIQPYYSHKGWVPICRDYFGNQIAVDLAPGATGSWGQVIVFGRDFDTKLVIASNLQEFLFIFVSDLENGNYKIDQSEIDASFGYLEASRNDDDFIGDEDEGEGELLFYDKDNEFGKSGNPLTYLDVLKRRTLKKHGITNVNHFVTSFVPQPTKRQERPTESHSAGASNTDLSNTPSPIINLESTSKVNLPKETIIDDKSNITEEANEETKPEEAEVTETKTPEVNETEETKDEPTADASEELKTVDL
ncbi:Cell wall assembly regulator [Yamadazyma tenuis]|uniref:Cell wall assembly and cell proliferation coordinating protein n=1 Tax=Candida tenuis (strain ATCC 10573 / BCRC 21748 / CBS 615 / JCM 9827 / NBRC 10315 / NRRL Y-1498 / VKM Y-70) TaxID=590646 RepID=G3BE18_CANTC|nr:cell wall assembly and cell proliferation coordinating protein [Yamadazyma tenuis ATCC 10573]EGV60434.1 cell wall assembly and cell proliferation coordinating protein [Yamadazyma tenuis ATCC 10573]WEJ94319.1 Cell wall assembly regulator [Yamadazyma tenuis]